MNNYIKKVALSFLVKGGNVVGDALRTGTNVVSDVLSGENFKTATNKRMQDAGRGMARKAIERVQSMIGRGTYKRKLYKITIKEVYFSESKKGERTRYF
ncbi:hypothetical protein NPIL_299641 [Nephila pilipes]|uniref:Uncharacterized protein n=1 Tax=Nephila pilipes TaxID=299642 RepID=A0A8X6MUC6_NEPPI|nr:hypothetical protein NPIL_299641 [Nephila pilipes]